MRAALQADEAHHIGPAASHLSYLNQQTIIEVAKKSGVQVTLHYFTNDDTMVVFTITRIHCLVSSM